MAAPRPNASTQWAFPVKDSLADVQPGLPAFWQRAPISHDVYGPIAARLTEHGMAIGPVSGRLYLVPLRSGGEFGPDRRLQWIEADGRVVYTPYLFGIDERVELVAVQREEKWIVVCTTAHIRVYRVNLASGTVHKAAEAPYKIGERALFPEFVRYDGMSDRILVRSSDRDFAVWQVIWTGRSVGLDLNAQSVQVDEKESLPWRLDGAPTVWIPHEMCISAGGTMLFETMRYNGVIVRSSRYPFEKLMAVPIRHVNSIVLAMADGSLALEATDMTSRGWFLRTTLVSPDPRCRPLQIAQKLGPESLYNIRAVALGDTALAYVPPAESYTDHPGGLVVWRAVGASTRPAHWNLAPPPVYADEHSFSLSRQQFAQAGVLVVASAELARRRLSSEWARQLKSVRSHQMLRMVLAVLSANWPRLVDGIGIRALQALSAWKS